MTGYPPFRPLTDAQARAAYGDPTGGVPLPPGARTFKPDPAWYAECVVPVSIDSLPGDTSALRKISWRPLSKRTVILLHTAVAPKFVALWTTWHEAGLLDRLVTFDGAFNPRLTRGGTRLSMHAYAAALDFNASSNRLGKPPAPLGAKGCVLELLPAAIEHGFFPGAYFRTTDAMHIEGSGD